MLDSEKSEIVGEKAAGTYRAIRDLRKSFPTHMNAAKKKELAAKEKELKDLWWEDVKHLMVKER